MLKLRTYLFALAFAVAGVPALAAKLALVVGNETYAHLPGSAGSVQDAGDIAVALQRLGFTVTVLTNADSAAFDAEVDRLAGQTAVADTVVFYYSGYAVQVDGQNHLLPVAANIASAEDVAAQARSMEQVVSKLQSGNAQVLIFLDASRRNPVQKTLGAKEGLAQIETSAGTFLSFAARPGTASYDKAGRIGNSPYMGALLSRLEEQGLSISDLMIWVRKEVRALTVGRQTPWEQSSLRTQFFFNPESTGLPEFETVAGSTIIGAVVAQPDPAPLPDDLPRAVQEELKRLGCYRLRVDGQWGGGSRSAVARYYQASKSEGDGAEGDGVEPSGTLYRRLLAEPDGLCPTPAARSAPRAKATPSGAAPRQDAAAKPSAKAPEPAKKSGGCTIFGVAVTCGKDKQ